MNYYWSIDGRVEAPTLKAACVQIAGLQIERTCGGEEVAEYDINAIVLGFNNGHDNLIDTKFYTDVEAEINMYIGWENEARASDRRHGTYEQQNRSY